MRPTNKTRLKITTVRAGRIQRRSQADTVVTEEPLEIRLDTGGEIRSLAITMRTPGADFELAAGFLFSEGVVTSKDDIKTISYCVDRDLNETQRYNVVNVKLRHKPARDFASLDRYFVVSSSCGVCGKSSIDALQNQGLHPIFSTLQVTPHFVAGLCDKLRKAQRLFDITGGLHAAALFDADGNLCEIREDVGRHNAMDKLIGWAILSGKTALDNHLVLVSGRASFELVQKAISIGLPIFCAISAPSSLAVDLARQFNMTLIGFLRGEDCNIYCGQERMLLD